MNNSSVNQSNEVSPVLAPWFLYPVATGYILISAVAVIGNLLVCFAILANKSLRSKPTNLFLLSLAVSDFLTSAIAMPFDIESLLLQGGWKHGAVLCLAFLTAYLITVPTSILTLFGHQRGSLPKPSWSSAPLSPHTVHDKKESFNSDRSYMAVLHHFCFSSHLRMAVYKNQYEKRTRTMLNFLQCVVQHLEQFFELCFAIGNYLRVQYHDVLYCSQA